MLLPARSLWAIFVLAVHRVNTRIHESDVVRACKPVDIMGREESKDGAGVVPCDEPAAVDVGAGSNDALADAVGLPLGHEQPKSAESASSKKQRSDWRWWGKKNAKTAHDAAEKPVSVDDARSSKTSLPQDTAEAPASLLDLFAFADRLDWILLSVGCVRASCLRGLVACSSVCIHCPPRGYRWRLYALVVGCWSQRALAFECKM